MLQWEKYCLRKVKVCVAKLAFQNKEQIQELFHDKNFFLIVDEAEVAKQKYMNVLVCRLDASNQTFLVDCHPLDSGSNVNSSIILHTVDDILRQLEIKCENFLLILTDAARYMSSDGKTLKELYPFLTNVNCVAYLLLNCATRVCAHFKNIVEVIAMIKTATIKNKDRKKDFHYAGLPSPPDSVISSRVEKINCNRYSIPIFFPFFVIEYTNIFIFLFEYRICCFFYFFSLCFDILYSIIIFLKQLNASKRSNILMAFILKLIVVLITDFPAISTFEYGLRSRRSTF